ncbi:hypothetical protein C8J56DRAFT_1164924 [Mycena floridula]|nr:hypothetical protein C8J56DRAFT_1164924 [Mycena floridula]
MSSNSDEVFENPYCQRPGDDDIPVPGVLDLQWMWQPGDEITVKFLNGTDTARNEVKEHAVKWTGSGAANLTFNFVSDDKDALVRVKFDTGMNITRGLGTGCKRNTDQSQPTVEFSIPSNTPSYGRPL